jgi:endonuclease-3
MTTKQRYQQVIEWFKTAMPVAETELHYDTPFHLLLAVILSAQCTDKRVNLITPALFERFPSPHSLANASFDEVFDLIKSCSYPNNKARHLIGAAKMLVEDFNGEIPADIDSLVKLPGVGRKTANLLLGDLYGVPGSVVCDTHCIRICGRLGLSQGKEPEKVERQLRAILPPEESSDFCHRIVLFGRDCCTAQRPHCHECPLTMFCKEFNP